MKIAYIYSTMAKTGGTERMITEKANYLAEHYGYSVTIIACFQLATEDNIFCLSKKVRQINLAIPFFSQYKYRYPKRLWAKWKMNKLLKKSINEIVKKVDPDIIIGVSRFRADLISTIKCRAKKVIECHEARYNTIFDTRVNPSFPARVFIKIYEYLYFRTIERNTDAVITLTEGDKMLWNRAKYTEVIPNFSTMPIRKHSDCTQKRVIAVGRLSWEKGFERLIKVWGIVSSKYPDWHLDIFGEGDMHDTLKKLAQISKANNIYFYHSTPDISLEYANSSICTITSYFEGFSLVLLEAMKHGLPCVAFDCPFGPRNILDDECNGYLVEDNNIELFAERLCCLIENEELRKQFSKAAIKKASYYDVDIIMEKYRVFYEKIDNNI